MSRLRRIKPSPSRGQADWWSRSKLATSSSMRASFVCTLVIGLGFFFFSWADAKLSGSGRIREETKLPQRQQLNDLKPRGEKEQEPPLQRSRFLRRLRYYDFIPDIDFSDGHWDSGEVEFFVGFLLFMLLLSLILSCCCCCRGCSLCDILALVCIWDICCDNPGGYAIM